MNPDRLFSELHRRKVFRVAGVYIVAAWLVVQVADTFFPALRLPDWTVTFVAAVAILGFPVAVALAWAFDFTGEGVRRTEAGSGPAAKRPRVAAWLVVGVLIGTGVAAYAYVGPHPDAGPARPADADRSIAVLPFANVSGVEENAYFSDGITEDILTRLAAIEDLRVISRTSVMTYKGSDLTVPEIAAELGVRYVLEGSVRRVEDQVRITGQLIDARADEHLWAQSFDRNITDILALQGAIAGEIARALAVELSPEERSRLDHRPTSSPRAYDLYLRGREEMRSLWSLGPAGVPEALTSAEALFRRALAEDSVFAPAYVGLSQVFQSARELTEQVRFDSALAYARRALDIDPELPDAYVQLGSVYHSRLQRGRAWIHPAYDNYRAAVRLNPSHADAYVALAALAGNRGRTLDAIRNYRRALAVDPNNSNAWTSLGLNYSGLGYFDAAEAAFRRGVHEKGELACHLGITAVAAGDTASARAHLREVLRSPAGWDERCAFLIYSRLGEYRAAEEHLRRFIASLPEGGWHDESLTLAVVAHRNRKREEAERLLVRAEASARSTLEESPEWSFALIDLAHVHVLRGEYDEAVNTLEAADRGWPVNGRHLSMSSFGVLRGHPRFDALIARFETQRDSVRAQIEREGLHRIELP